MDAVIGCMDTSAAAEVIGNLDASAAVEVVAHLDYVSCHGVLFGKSRVWGISW